MMRIEVCARGRVQGVGFRFFIDDCAAQAGVSGYVRNIPDGSVSIVAEGKEDVLDHSCEWCRHPSGPVSGLIRWI